MEYVYPVAGFVGGMALLAASVFSAFVYTPTTPSVVDSVVTAFTGVTLQLGDFLAVSSVTAVLFDVLAAFGVRFSLPVPFAVGYLLTHVIVYYSSLRITDVQSQPLDPEFDIRENPLRLATLSIPGALLLLPTSRRQ
ncbi:hypothetical protein GCM10008995_10550 [Halobellus salinus]|uniref:DUF8133 domain-containing protein n=1 Tax=Halobellus salinus TaxID=931585 RepID=A0A830ELI6_9EURY|nr:hypothetical protein [Halobellus salinus]GGJ02672.1 hypothetical protein GCM10008995_10550 [Halobellus salinus]SMP16757.1 hypothetical protein SAMN06265347_10620 [Halobellus salinus]